MMRSGVRKRDVDRETDTELVQPLDEDEQKAVIEVILTQMHAWHIIHFCVIQELQREHQKYIRSLRVALSILSSFICALYIIEAMGQVGFC